MSQNNAFWLNDGLQLEQTLPARSWQRTCTVDGCGYNVVSDFQVIINWTDLFFSHGLLSILQLFRRVRENQARKKKIKFNIKCRPILPKCKVKKAKNCRLQKKSKQKHKMTGNILNFFSFHSIFFRLFILHFISIESTKPNGKLCAMQQVKLLGTLSDLFLLFFIKLSSPWHSQCVALLLLDSCSCFGSVYFILCKSGCVCMC